ncbi:MAG TPA: YihA family ribosome biogenesis GTP-binding protein [Saprospirales bacterium]|nr:YihA family ribosome biogenesis GTP-binding protein [Saprospirales bacterium]
MDYQINEISFIGSFADVADCPSHDFNEYAFIGRSNVGKSSLINFLGGREGIARISNKPGKTQTINMYLADNAWCMVDLPGYGFALTSKKNRGEWKKMIYRFIESRPNLINTFVLLDSRIPLQKIDLEFMSWLAGKGIAFSIVFTKVDGLKKSIAANHLNEIKKGLLEYWEELPPQFLTSAVKKQGKQELLGYIDELNKICALNHE